MEIKNIIKDYLKEEKYNNSNGLSISYNNNEVLISGSKLDLIELCNYILNVALEKESSHIHLDNLSLISDKSNIKELIIQRINNDR